MPQITIACINDPITVSLCSLEVFNLLGLPRHRNPWYFPGSADALPVESRP